MAIRMSSALVECQAGADADGAPANGVPHREPKEVNEVLEEIAQSDEQIDSPPETSAHYRAVIGPFLQRLEEVKSVDTGARPPQIGDEELAAISQR
jgi:hypothetical protein